MSTLMFKTPRYIYLPRKTKEDKKISLGTNWYRNAFRHELNDAKKIFKGLVKASVGDVKFKHPIKVSIAVGAENKRKFDLDNFSSVTFKFLCDALVELGCIPDDHYEHIVSLEVTFGGITKGKPPENLIIIEEVLNV